jgi:hypothetical protein
MDILRKILMVLAAALMEMATSANGNNASGEQNCY